MHHHHHHHHHASSSSSCIIVIIIIIIFLVIRLLARNDDLKANSKQYDIYHNTNIPEVIKIKPVMTSFKIRLDELLAEWPGNPLFLQVRL